MTEALFDILLQSNNKPNSNLESIDESFYKSIQEHLNKLLNARQGALQHLPDYGLPDMAEIFQTMPYSINTLLVAVANTIEKYEPRIKNIKVFHKATSATDCLIFLEMYAVLYTNKTINFGSYFMKDGSAVVDSRDHCIEK